MGSRFQTVTRRNLCEGVLDRGELVVRIGADGPNGDETDHGNQREHNRVFDGSRAFFLQQKLLDASREYIHRRLPQSVSFC
jgi:hypothetical protein